MYIYYLYIIYSICMSLCVYRYNLTYNYTHMSDCPVRKRANISSFNPLKNHLKLIINFYFVEELTDTAHDIFTRFFLQFLQAYTANIWQSPVSNLVLTGTASNTFDQDTILLVVFSFLGNNFQLPSELSRSLDTCSLCLNLDEWKWLVF